MHGGLQAVMKTTTSVFVFKIPQAQDYRRFQKLIVLYSLRCENGSGLSGSIPLDALCASWDASRQV